MPKGYTGVILRINLSSKSFEKVELGESFYRTYMGGGAIGAYFLLHETQKDTDPFHEDNVLTIAPSITTGSNVSGVSRCSAVALSPLSNGVGEGQAGGSIGPAIKKAGYDAIVIKGKAEELSLLHIHDDQIEFKPATHLSQKSVGDTYELLREQHKGAKVSILQCGPAGENKVRFASLMVDRNDAVGRTGLGAVMGSKNLKAVVVQSKNKVAFHDPESLKSFNRSAKQNLPTMGFPQVLKKHGTPGVVSIQANSGNIASFNFKHGYHKDHSKLDGATYEKQIGAGQTTCPGCVVACRKRVKADHPYKVSDRLGGPEFETLSLLGTNLNISDPVAVAKANELCNDYGLDTITTGAIVAYLFEAFETKTISSDVSKKKYHFGNPEDLFELIELIAKRKGIGDILADGFEAAIKELGEKTAPFAIHCKGQGLPAHMAQVKPSQALMYAAVPIGGDHMSAEHDWFLNPDDQDCRALGIVGEGDAKSTNLAKIRMVAYSQIYYAALDTLTLCMFIWGPGNVFQYRDLENLVSYSTGWKTSLWELMKVGERKINMMKQINSRRGFRAEHDILPDRLYEPLPDGPSKGACVDRNHFPLMLRQYYGLMGWDQMTGAPTTQKLEELGLEWALEK